MRRRDFLAKLTASTLAAGSLLFDNPFRPRFRIANAQAATGKTLIVVFQKGGCDGLNTVVPYTDPNYYNLRPTIGIAPPFNGAESAIYLDQDFGLHPGLSAFESIYQAGDLAILPTVHYPDATRSHFDGQFLVESAPPQGQQGVDGWLNRHLVSRPSSAPLPAVGFATGEDSSLPDSLRGQAIVSTFSDMTTFNLGLEAAEETTLLQRLQPIYEQNADPSKIYAQQVHDFGRAVIDDLNLIADIDFNGYIPANGAVYPSTDLGRSMKQTAQLIKEGVGLEVAALTRHGWDLHKNQGGGESTGKHYDRLADFGDSIAALYQDLGGLMTDVVILTMTEFGRKVKENQSGGTDHGHAAAWFVVSPNVTGGIYLGSGWPGLAPEQLNNKALAHTLDYRDVYAEVLLRHLGNTNLATVLPGHSYTPINFLPV